MSRVDDLIEQVGEGRILPPDDPAFAMLYPFLWEMLTTDRWGDETERILPRLTIDRISGGYIIGIQDDSLCHKKSVRVLTIEDAWKALEATLNDPDAPWMAFKSYRNKKGPKVQEKEKKGRRKKR